MQCKLLCAHNTHERQQAERRYVRSKRIFQKHTKKNEVLSNESRSLITALTLGDKRDLDRDTKEEFAKAGASHILAVSGLHVGIIIGFVYLLLSKILRIENKLILHGITIAVVGLYALLTGGEPPVVRTWLMYVTACLPIVLKRQGDIVNSLCLAAFILLIIDPNNLFNLSFLLSFGAVCGIVYMAKILEEYSQDEQRGGVKIVKIGEVFGYKIRLYYAEKALRNGREGHEKIKKEEKVATWADCVGKIADYGMLVLMGAGRKAKGFVMGMLVMTIGAQIFTLPIVLCQFHYLAFGGSVASLVAIPIATVLIPITLMYFVFSAIGGVLGIQNGIDTIFGYPMEWLAKGMLKTMENISALRYAGIDHIPFDKVDAVIATIGIILIAIYLLKRERWILWGAVGVFVSGIVYSVVKFQEYKDEEFVCIYNTYGTTTVNYCGNGENVMYACNDTVRESFWKIENFWANHYLPEVELKGEVNCFEMRGKRICVLNGNGIEIDSVYALIVTRECREKAVAVLGRIKTRRVVMDGSCKKWMREMWKRECEERGIKYWDVREGGSLRIDSDEE